MKNLYDETRASKCKDDLDLRVYTSVKSKLNDEDVLYVKGSGWDLESIQREGFAPVKLDVLLEMAKQDELSDSEMVRLQREAMLDKNAPNLSVEAILHNHGIFTFDDDAKTSYTRMINAVTLAEEFLEENALVNIARNYTHSECDIPKITKVLSVVKGYDVSININQTPLASFYASLT